MTNLVIRSSFVSLAAAATLASMMLIAGAPAAKAAVYCKYVGVPKGCVAKPGVVLAPAPVVGAPVAAAAVATPGVGAPGVGVRAGTPANRGGPVNRVGRR